MLMSRAGCSLKSLLTNTTSMANSLKKDIVFRFKKQLAKH